MQFEIEPLEDDSHLLTISNLSEEERRAFEADPELLVVGLEFDGKVGRRVFPAGTPYLELTLANLRRLHPQVLPQAAPDAVPDWERAIDLVLERLASSGVEWMFIGGAALVVQGVQINPGDVDVITNVAGAKAMNDIFSDCLITPAAPLADWGHFGRAFHGAKIEWAGNDPSENPQMWNLGAPQRVISWRGRDIRVALLETYLRIERNRGRADRVAAIEAVLGTTNERT
jgi:hypothetical protein